METNDPRMPTRDPASSAEPGAPWTDQPERSSTAGRAGERAASVATETRSEISNVGSEVADQTKVVLEEAAGGVRDVVDEARRVVHDEADKQTHALSSGVRALAGDLQRMARQGEGETPVAGYVGRFGQGLGSVADRLDDGGIDGALDEARRVARQHPGMFLTGAALSGFALARVLRHADAPSRAGSRGTAAAGQPELTGGDLTEYGRSQLRSTTSATDDVDLRDDYQRRPGDAPQLRDDMQEWVRP
jgi:hypothetical protein